MKSFAYLCVFSLVYLLYCATVSRLDGCLNAICQQQLCLFGESQTGCVLKITLCLYFLTSSSRWWLSVWEFSFLVISEPVWWIKVYMEVMWLNSPFLWQVIDLRSICFRRNTLWTHVGGRWCLAVLWNSQAWCIYTDYKKRNEITVVCRHVFWG